MNFQQLRIIRETVRCNFNLTEVANSLYTSQSGVSKHIKDLEDELGVELFVRKGKRLLGMTEPGREMVKIVERLLLDAQNIKNLADQYSQQDKGHLVLATTHTQARYVLPNIVLQFRLRYPAVKLQLHQGSPQEIAQMLLEGRADIGIATEALAEVEGLISYPYHSWHHAVVVPAGHALDKKKKHTIEIVIDRVTIDPAERARISDSVETAVKAGGGSIVVAVDGEPRERAYSEARACPSCGVGLPELSPQSFQLQARHTTGLECRQGIPVRDIKQPLPCRC